VKKSSPPDSAFGCGYAALGNPHMGKETTNPANPANAGLDAAGYSSFRRNRNPQARSVAGGGDPGQGGETIAARFAAGLDAAGDRRSGEGMTEGPVAAIGDRGLDESSTSASTGASTGASARTPAMGAAIQILASLRPNRNRDRYRNRGKEKDFDPDFDGDFDVDPGALVIMRIVDDGAGGG
jgi:hypothetical protein